MFDPQLSSTTSSAHWRKEPGTNNLLNFHIKGMPGNWCNTICFDNEITNPRKIPTETVWIHCVQNYFD